MGGYDAHILRFIEQEIIASINLFQGKKPYKNILTLLENKYDLTKK